MTIVKAGAGAGKTYTIQTELTEWVRKREVHPDRILAVTFTNAAAGELRERIRLDLMAARLHREAALIQQSTITTIHSFGLQLMQSFAYDMGMSPQPRQLTDAEQQLLTRSVLAELTSLDPILMRLKEYGYTGKSDGTTYTSAADSFKNRIMQIVSGLRTLGTTAGREDWLMSKALQTIHDIYGEVSSSPELLEQQLLRVVDAVRQIYNEETLLQEWGSNPDSRNFVKAIFTFDETTWHTWDLWTQLQQKPSPKIIKKGRRHPHAELAEDIWAAADRLRDHPGPLEDAIEHIRVLLQAALGAIDGYQQQKRQSGLVDYPDMVQLAEELLHNDNWRAEAASRYDCLVIDEFQDTNPLQFALMHHFQAAGLRTLIVGDRKQSIMRFQGADSRLFTTLAHRCEDSSEDNSEGSAGDELRVLDANWRSTPELMAFLNAAGSLLFPNDYTELVPKSTLHSDLTPVQRLMFSKDEWIAKPHSKSSKPAYNRQGQDMLAQHLRSLIDSGAQITDRHTKTRRAVRPSDIAVLAKTHSNLRQFASTLQQVGLESSLSDGGFLESPAVRTVMNALQYLQDSGDRFALLDLLTEELIGADLQGLLSHYLTANSEQGDTTCFGHPLELELINARTQIQLLPVADATVSVIAVLDLDTRILQHPHGQQLRADVLKLISLAHTFTELQSESLQAMGIYGKSISAFLAWLQADADALDERPEIDPNAENAVVLKTWHGSKGLEWPVVMVLDLEKEPKMSLPAIQPAYPSMTIEAIMQEGYVQIIPPFTDSRTNAASCALLDDAHHQDIRSLTYVALTRAREQLILPWLPVSNDQTPQQLIAGLFADGTQAAFRFQDIRMSFTTDESGSIYAGADLAGAAASNWHMPSITLSDTPAPLPGFLEPSGQHTVHSSDTTGHSVPETPERQIICYGPSLSPELLDSDRVQSTAELGTAVHRLYQVYCLQPHMLQQAISLPPLSLPAVPAPLLEHLAAFTACLQAQLHPRSLHCEQHICSTNERGQTTYGTIDLIAHTDSGLWIIDHKTDRVMDFQRHIGQLLSYAAAAGAKHHIAGIAINWTSSGTLEFLGLNPA